MANRFKEGHDMESSTSESCGCQAQDEEDCCMNDDDEHFQAENFYRHLNIPTDYRAWMHYWWQYRSFMVHQFWSRYYGSYGGSMEPCCPCTCDDDDDDYDRGSAHESLELNADRSNVLKRTRTKSPETSKLNHIKCKKRVRTEIESTDICNFDACEQDNVIESNELDDEFEVELNDEFREFLEISKKHRQEREKASIQEEKNTKTTSSHSGHKKDQSDFELVDDVEQCLVTTTEAPKRCDKQEKYKQKYGNDCEEILSLEADIQLNFDKFCDTNKPAYWPNIPLRL